MRSKRPAPEQSGHSTTPATTLEITYRVVSIFRYISQTFLKYVTVIYNMSIDRADKPWIGDRRFTEYRMAIGRSLSLQRPPSIIILGTRGLESYCTWAVPSPWGAAPAPFDTPHIRMDPISHCSTMPQSWNPLYTSHRHPKQPQTAKIALVTCP